MSRSGRGAYLSGRAGEEIAARLYLAEGASLRATRWKCPEGEIDLIFELSGTIVFVEVKARRDARAAAEAITPRQWQRLEAAAARYLAQETDGRAECRFDVVTIDRAGQVARQMNARSFDEW